jgi:hypothetical protein
MRTKLLLIILAPLILITLYSCYLDTSYREWWEEELNRESDRWEAAAAPGIICPNEEVTVTWNVGALRCGDGTSSDCVEFTATNQSTDTEIFSNDLASSFRVVRDITSDTNFIYSVTADNLDVRPLTWDTKFDRVEVITVTTGYPKSYNFTAKCVNSTVTPTRLVYNLDRYSLDMASSEFIESTKGFGECVRITKIARIDISQPPIDDETITIFSIDREQSLPPTSLELGESIEPIDLPTDLSFEVEVENSSVPFREGAGCGGREESLPSDIAEPPPMFGLIFYLSCDTRMEGCR